MPWKTGISTGTSGATAWGTITGVLADQTDAQAALDLKAPKASPTFTGTVGGVTAAMVGLGNVTNTSDAAKPVSTAQQTALDLKANLAGPTFTGTVAGVTAAMVGLGSVNNTADSAKPVSTAQQTALDLKANLAGPTFTGTVAGITAAMVGLGNVNNTTDAGKPVSTAQQTALNLKVDANAAIVASTNTKVTYDAKGLVTSATAATTADFADSLDKRFCTDAQKTIIGNTSGTNSGNVTLAGQTYISISGQVITAAAVTLSGTHVSGVLGAANGGISAAPTSATTGAMTVAMTSTCITITPTGACTFNGSGGVAGQPCTFFITTSGSSSFVLTWGTNFKTTATLATGVTTAKTFTVSFICKDGTTWAETARTVAM